MQKIDGRFIYSASDLNNYLECRRLTELDRQVAEGMRLAPEADDSVDLIAKKGDEHERHYLEQLRERHGDHLIAFEDRPENTIAGLQAAEVQTVAAMERGAQLIYQATFFDGQFLGRADFLRRIEAPCARWSWSYEVIDTKLALSPKPYFLIQLCNYSEHLERIQKTVPEFGYIVLGSGEERRFRINDYAAYYRHLKASLLSHIDTLGDVYPYECKHCDICRWSEDCEEQRDRDDHLSLVAAIRRDQIEKLKNKEITTLAQLADAADDQRPFGMSDTTFANLRAQAMQQHKQRRAYADGQRLHFYEFRPSEETAGFAKLPRPAPGDVFFDIEGDPLYRPDRGLEYLFGVFLPEENEYKSFWATDPSLEQRAFEQLVDFIVQRLREYGDLHVYHYGHYEVTVLKRLMGRFASREREIDDFLRRGIFVDLLPVVRQGLWISQPSYSLKKVEAFYEWRRETQTKGGDDSILMFESWLESGDDSILEDIRQYNEDDVRSTHQLRDWLLIRRNELNAQLPAPLPWREPPEAEEPEDSPRTELESRLLDGLPAPDSIEELRASAESVRARWLLGNLLRYHRREQKPEWWKYYERCENPEDLEEHDREALGHLSLRRDIAPYKRNPRDHNLVITYEFPPQDHRLPKRPLCPYTRGSAGEVISTDDSRGLLEIKLAKAIEPSALRALIPGKPIPDDEKRAATERIAEAYLNGSLEREFPATVSMLLGRAPQLEGRAAGAPVQPTEVNKETVSRIIASLDASHLFIQGPPGSGKSTIGAWAIADLLEKKKRVGIVANGHKALHNLLKQIEEAARARNLQFAGCHKKSGMTEGSDYGPLDGWPMVQNAATIEPMLDKRCLLASGTTYAWADERLRGTFDYVFIEEAGQVPLADALIASLAGKNAVLLGDPLQLPQVSQGSHPLGTNLSILQHLLKDNVTIPADEGIFLTSSFRMAPPICDFISGAIYEGRLHPDAQTCDNHIESEGTLSGAGLRYIPVDHDGNSRHSPEEAREVAERVDLLLRGYVAINGKSSRRVTQDDILVVTPYNLQRQKITELLVAAGHGGVRVGTVDKFQGQEAPIVFYSMATSSAETLPRDMGFLFDKNRFNVAISRAQCLSILVCSPRLLDIRCSSPETMALVNLLCAFAEAASCIPKRRIAQAAS